MTKLQFKLVRPAKKQGGDRYEHGIKGDADFMVIYLPQSISRTESGIKRGLTITIE